MKPTPTLGFWAAMIALWVFAVALVFELVRIFS